MNLSGKMFPRTLRAVHQNKVVWRLSTLSSHFSGFLTMMVFPVAAGYVTDPTLAVVFMTLGIGLSGFTESGYLINHLDIAPPFASVLMGISNTAGTMAGIISPTLTGFITHNHVRECRLHFSFSCSVDLIILNNLLTACNWLTDGRTKGLTCQAAVIGKLIGKLAD